MQITNTSDLEHLSQTLNVNGPRYTSYPTANLFSPGDFSERYRHAWERGANKSNNQSNISIYIHVPFCSTVCFYCACNKIHTANKVHAQTYTQHLGQEIELQQQVVGQRNIAQLHFGGGTPTTLSHHQFDEIFEQLSGTLKLSSDPNRDYSIEIDPRGVTVQDIAQLAQRGFNRISVGVQDFDPAVQAAVNRLQTEQETAQVINAARDNGFGSVSVDLIYGLPLQTEQGFQRTLEQTMKLAPDRISLYSYAHLPQRFKTQRQICSEQLPKAQTKLRLFTNAVAYLEQQDYVYIGMDHFAKRHDSIVQAMQQGLLQRNFMGYSTHANCDLLSLGVSAIGQTENLYTQNHKTLPDYYKAIDQQHLPLERGIYLSRDDKLRRWVIASLMCNMGVEYKIFAGQFACDFNDYFADAAASITLFEDHGLVESNVDGLSITPMGRYFIRNICMLFDAHLPTNAAGFSKTV